MQLGTAIMLLGMSISLATTYLLVDLALGLDVSKGISYISTSIILAGFIVVIVGFVLKN